MDKKYGEFVGVDKLYFAEITQDDEDGYAASAPEYLAPAAEIAGEAEVNNTPTYYDDKPGFNYVSEGVTTLTITVSNVPAQLAARLLGKSYDADSGRVYDSGQPKPPEVAFGFRFDMGPRDHRYYWYLKGTFSGGSEEAASKSNDVDIRTYQLTFTAVATTHEWTIDGEPTALKRVFADTADSAFDATGWFTQVQTPDTSGAPDALTVSSVPADGATGVDASANIVLTFNNKISSHAISLIDETFSPVAAAYSFDTAGKVLTINPDANLSASTGYAIIVNGVKDVYGQALANQVIDFETAS